MSKDAIILVGGKGTRLASVIKDVPKPMASLDDGRPFVDVIVKRLKAQNINRIFMATGHLAQSIHEYYKGDSQVICIKEDMPMGTGGAVLNAIHAIDDLSDPFYVLNGDSFYPFDLSAFDKAPCGTVLLGVVDMGDSARYGTVDIDKNDEITSFVEKTGDHKQGFVNAGVYCVRKSYFESLPVKPCSIEVDIFPILAQNGQLKAVKNNGPMLDIGLPGTYAGASQFIKDLDA